MQVRTFQGKNLSQIMAQIKKEMGPEAVILSSERIGNNGSSRYEVVAALEQQQLRQPVKGKPSNPNSHFQILDQLYQEWESFRDSLLTILRPEDNLKIPNKYVQAISYLKKQGVKKNILLNLSLKLSQGHSLLGLLKEQLKVRPWPEKFLDKKYQFFIGPPGSGQTSVLLKSLLSLKKPDQNILLAYPSGSSLEGKLLLEHYAQLLNLDFSPCALEELPSSKHNIYDFVFVDLPHNLLDLSHLLGKIKKIGHLHLILSPVYQESYLRSFLNKLNLQEISSVIWTRLDEADSLGSIINFSTDYNIPISFLSYGSQLKNSSFKAEPAKILRFLFKKEI